MFDEKSSTFEGRDTTGHSCINCGEGFESSEELQKHYEENPEHRIKAPSGFSGKMGYDSEWVLYDDEIRSFSRIGKARGDLSVEYDGNVDMVYIKENREIVDVLSVENFNNVNTVEWEYKEPFVLLVGKLDE